MLAALFPGQGSQIVGMGKAFYDTSSAAKTVLDQAEAAFPGLLTLMWDGPEEALTLTANQQPALVAVGAAAFAAYLEAGGQAPSYAAGHSLGEFTAHVAAGSLSVAEAVTLVHGRGSYMQEAVPEGKGAMAAVLKVSAAQVIRVCHDVGEETGGVVEIANLNSPAQTVISGEAAAVAAASERLRTEGARVMALNVSAPFHCRLMAPAAARLARDLEEVDFKAMTFPIICNVTAEPLAAPEEAPRVLEAQVTRPVRWQETIETLHNRGVGHFVEFGAGRVLGGLVKRTLTGVEALAVTDPDSLEQALAAL